MARLIIQDYIDISSDGVHNATTWQIALDSGFTQIIDESINDTVNVKEWHSPLPFITGNGYYADLDQLYARVKVHVDDAVSEWFVLPVANQNIQAVTITEKNKPDIVTTSVAINMH
jgi:hypothetical protein